MSAIIVYSIENFSADELRELSRKLRYGIYLCSEPDSQKLFQKDAGKLRYGSGGSRIGNDGSMKDRFVKHAYHPLWLAASPTGMSESAGGCAFSGLAECILANALFKLPNLQGKKFAAIFDRHGVTDLAAVQLANSLIPTIQKSWDFCSSLPF
ncbi:MAG: hypothetical protein ABF636_07310 [Acetobacter sp.]|uniref:hypothetical protein n=1 Tax=Acetobacter sp. TaxID=440 RepID=UPI0039E8718A